MKIFFLLNPSRRQSMWDLREQAARAAKRSGSTPRFGEVDRLQVHSTEHLLGQAIEEGCSRVVGIGGDGTLHEIINRLAQKKRLSKMEVAVVPAGTCNDFARSLGLRERRLGQAFEVACAGKPRLTDLGQMDSKLFLNNAGIGRRPLAQRRRLLPLQTLRRFQPIPLRIRWDRGSIEGSFFMTLVCNAPFFSGGLHFSSSLNTQDGLLDVYLVPALPKWQLLPILAWAKLGRPARFRRLVSLRVTRMEIEASADLWPQADGEPPLKALRHVVFAVSPEKAMIVTP
jgi:diacylglycerol kinase (ATP)